MTESNLCPYQQLFPCDAPVIEDNTPGRERQKVSMTTNSIKYIC